METGCSKPKKESPIETAFNKLGNEIAKVQETTVKFETILASVLGQSEKPISSDETQSKGQTSLECRLLSMKEQIMDINANLQSIQNRIQL